MKIKRLLLIQLVWIVVFGFLFVNPNINLGKTAERKIILSSCENLYGKRVDKKKNLYEINQFYVLEVKFGKGGNLQELFIEPKYFFEEEHPEWKKTDDFVFLTQYEFEYLLKQLDLIKPKGLLIFPSSNVAVVTNLTAHYQQCYEHSTLEWGRVVDLRDDDLTSTKIRWFKLSYHSNNG